MGNAVSNVLGRRREPKEHREARMQASTEAARSRLRQNVRVDTRLALRNETEQTKAAMVTMMDHQLMRSGKPFIKADLVGILLYAAVLRGDNPLPVVRNCTVMTNDEICSKIRTDMYASRETLSALQHLGTGGMPVAAYASPPSSPSGGETTEVKTKAVSAAAQHTSAEPGHYPSAYVSGMQPQHAQLQHAQPQHAQYSGRASAIQDQLRTFQQMHW